MPLILGFFVAVVIIYLSVAVLIPTFAGWLTSILIGKTAKFDKDNSLKLGVYYYLITGALYGIAAIYVEGTEGLVIIWYMIVCIFLWPFPMIFELFGIMTGMSLQTISGIFVASFIITQLVAVHMILKKARADTENLD